MKKLTKQIFHEREYVTAVVEVDKFSESETESGKLETKVTIYALRGGLDENTFSIPEAALVLDAWRELVSQAKTV